MNEQHQHIVKSHDDEQTNLRDSLLHMGHMAANQLDAALDTISHRDDIITRQVISGDAAIDAMEQHIDQNVIRLIQRGPLASDLRIILASLRMASDIERIGDYAANIAKRSLVLNQLPPLPHTHTLDTLGRMATQQLRATLAAYLALDAEAAQRIRERDAELDMLYTSLFRELLTYMMEDPRAITPCTHLLFMAKNVERIGDHATNIAENLWFQIHGDATLPPRDKRDGSSVMATTSPPAD